MYIVHGTTYARIQYEIGEEEEKKHSTKAQKQTTRI